MVLDNSTGPDARPLLTTKLDPPVDVHCLVGRPALVDRLASAPTPLTLVDAPAGWGKSSLISEWFKADDRPFAFLRLGTEDDDPRSFWAYTSAALGRIIPDWVPAIDDALRAPGIDPTRMLVPNIINALHDHDQPLVLVLDDYHTITDPEVHRSVAYLIDNAPQCLHLVISTRSDPPLPIPTYRAAGAVTEIRVNDLRLSPGETQLLVDQRFGIALSAHDAEILCERTEGWPAGIQLAAVSLAADPTTSPSAFIASFAGDDRNIADYLTTEVLRRQPEQRRHFLLVTSLLDEFNADLCDHLLQTTNSAAMLQEIEDHNLFLVPLDSRREWFRYHHLLQDWLRHLHRSTAQPEMTVELQRRAAQWMLDNGFTDRAIAQLLDAGGLVPYPGTFGVSAASHRRSSQGGGAELTVVVSAATRTPRGASRAGVTTQRFPDAARNRAADVMDSIAAREPMMGHQPIRRWIDALPDELMEDRPALALARVSRLQSLGDFPGAQRMLNVAEQAIGALDDSEQRDTLVTTVRVYRGMEAIGKGDMATAAQVYEALLQERPPVSSLVRTATQGLLGLAQFWTAGPEVALPHMRQSADDRRRLSIPDFGLTSLLAAAYAELGRWTDAEAAATEALSMPTVEGTTYPFNMAAHYAMAVVLQHQGRVDEAIEQLEQGLEQARAWVEPYFVGWGCFIKAQLVNDPSQRRELLAEAKQLTLASVGTHRLLGRIEAAEHHATQPHQTRTLATGMILDPLTPREVDVLRLLRGDLSVREIGNELYISYNTAKGYTKTIYQKLAVNSRAAAIATATAANLI